MEFFDLLEMSANNLTRRKMRTFLTVLGVLIGTASIVVMLSLGFGLNKSTMEQIEESGGLTTITVYGNGSYDDYVKSGELKGVLCDTSIASLTKLEHVTLVSPVMNFSVLLRQGSYEQNTSLTAMSLEAMKEMNMPIGEGKLPGKGDELSLIFGNQTIYDFYNYKTEENYWDTKEQPDVDLLGTPFLVVFDVDSYYSAQSGEGTPPKKYAVNGTASIKGTNEEYNEFSWNIYCDIDALQTKLKKIFRGRVIPGQPETKSGKPYAEFSYDQAYVYVDKMENVTDVQKQITEMGYEAWSNAEYLESMQNQYRMIQAVLGGIGAVSLFVAAIGIANTMMMSIYERTKEIGIIKELGCDMGVIRQMFLWEAGFIGLLGGFFGLLLSYLLSFGINFFLGGLYSEGGSTTVSYIPIWLPFVSLVFAVLVGMVAGFFPAKRAMELSPLAAIRNE